MALSILAKNDYVMELLMHIDDPRTIYNLMRVCREMCTIWKPYLEDMYNCLYEVEFNSATINLQFRFSDPTNELRVILDGESCGFITKIAKNVYLTEVYIVKQSDYFSHYKSVAMERFNSIVDFDPVERIRIRNKASNIYEAMQIIKAIHIHFA